MNKDGTVFVVDDDLAMRDSLALLLGLKGYRSRIFASAADFLEAYSPAWSGCVMIDVRMPGMDGLQLQAELCRRGCNLPVIIMTAYGDIATARNALKAGAVDFMEKPINDAMLIDVLESTDGERQPP